MHDCGVKAWLGLKHGLDLFDDMVKWDVIRDTGRKGSAGYHQDVRIASVPFEFEYGMQGSNSDSACGEMI